eukprot:CAMPEP_0182881472 /NCGR_PEP_ID=MMETSP0034_2-20130328/17201_1 /TAXON_ID=156128 /ORGANISM="Nephroselmis pyriformis, Strain CCMP717" /LENGTH=69 /DNA_ID=CAMNT_0025014503 /DNA_START=177 /DNA_END=383 /DNA_ORIENTATION=+
MFKSPAKTTYASPLGKGVLTAESSREFMDGYRVGAPPTRFTPARAARGLRGPSPISTLEPPEQDDIPTP